MSPAEVLQQTLRANDIDEMPDCKSMQEFLANKFICAVKLDLPKNEIRETVRFWVEHDWPERLFWRPRLIAGSGS